MTDAPPRPLLVRTFMTHDMADEDITALSTGHDAEFRRLLNAIDRSRRAAPGPLQHVVLYGSRGFGKSFMARRVQIEVTMPDRPGGAVVYLLLPEEQHNLQRSPHAFLDTIALNLKAAAGAADAGYAAALFQWPKPGEEARRWEEAAARLEAAIDAALPDGAGLVVAVVENFDVLLATLFKADEDEQRLRLWLDRPGNRLMLFATATGTVDIDYDRPLFKAFEPVRLSPWTPDDCLRYFDRRRGHGGQPPLGGEQQAKARAIAEFIGGTPRLAQLLAGVIDSGDALTVAETMTALADRLAEYYRRRIEDLPPLGRGLLDALIRGGEPASQTELAARVGADGQNTIARVMTDLQLADIVRGRPAPDSRETLYRVTDRVFVHYYRLRQGSRTARETPLATILDFLKSFYSRDEQREQSLQHLLAGRPAEAALFSRLALEGEERGGDDYTRSFANALEDYLEAAPGLFEGGAAAIVQLLESRPEDAHELCRQMNCATPAAKAIAAVVRAQALHLLGHSDRAQAALEAACEAAGGDPAARVIALEQLAIFLFFVKRNPRVAADYCRRLQVNPSEKLPIPLVRRSQFLFRCFTNGIEELQQAEYEVRRATDLLKGNYEMIPDAEALECTGGDFDLRKLETTALEMFQVAEELSGRICNFLQENQATAHNDLFPRPSHLWEQWLPHIRDRCLHIEEILKRVKAVSLGLLAVSFRGLGRGDDAWAAASKGLAFARAAGDAEIFSFAASAAVNAAAIVPRSEVITVFEDWLIGYRAGDRVASETQRGVRPSIYGLVAAATRARAFAQLDRILYQHGAWLAEARPETGGIGFVAEVLARVAAADGRAAGYEAAAGLLPRLARFMQTLPADKRDPTWLPDLISGFARACRDPGLLRDVATLLTDDLEPGAADLARLLQDIAAVDEAADAETVLARMDPDTATLIRRLRDLPDPPPVAPKRRSGRKRKPGG